MDAFGKVDDTLTIFLVPVSDDRNHDTLCQHMIPTLVNRAFLQDSTMISF